MALQKLLEDYFDVPAEMEQFVGAWQSLDPTNQCVFDGGDSFSEQLGVGRRGGRRDLGSAVPHPDQAGSVDGGAIPEFLPGGSAYEQLRELSRFFCGTELEIEVQLILKRDEVPKCDLGEDGLAGPRLVGSPGEVGRLLTARRGYGFVNSMRQAWGKYMGYNVRSLIGKLNDPTRQALEAAAGLLPFANALRRRDRALPDEACSIRADGDFACIAEGLRHRPVAAGGGADAQPRQAEVRQRPQSRFSPSLMKMLTEAWTLGSIDFNAARVRTGFTLLALVTDEDLSRIMREVSKELQKIKPDALRKEFQQIVRSSAETAEAAAAASAGGAGGPRAAPGSKTPNLDQYTVNLTENAKNGKIDPVLGARFRNPPGGRHPDPPPAEQSDPDGRGRRRQDRRGGRLRRCASPHGDVPPVLKNVTVRTLDLALLQAGAGVKGEFENRLKSLIEEVKSSPTPIILFIDEAHTMIGAGGQAGQNDAANLLKPALARGELRTLAATTWSEYKKYFEKDPALARRFQVVKVEEPSEGSAP